MNSRKNYQSLVDNYRAGAQAVKKLGTVGMVMQIGIIGFINGWKHLEIGHYKIAAPLLLSLSLYFLVKDFITLRRLEENMAQMILDGVDIEKKNAAVGKFFHELLQSFNLTNILVQRSLIKCISPRLLGLSDIPVH